VRECVSCFYKMNSQYSYAFFSTWLPNRGVSSPSASPAVAGRISAERLPARPAACLSLAKYKRTVSLFGMADTFTHINKPAVRASRHRSPFHQQFLRARIRARRHLHRPARPRHHPLHLHRRHRPLRFMLTCARSRCMHSWRGGAMPPELPRRLVCCVRLWRCSLDATWWIPSQHGRARVGLRRRSHMRWVS